MKHTILSGIQPTGRLHIGNYFGALANWIKLQNDHHSYFFVADYHAITGEHKSKEKKQEIITLAKSFLAAGLDPHKATLFIQSYIPEHTELTWIFNTVTPVSFLERMTQYKDKAAQQVQNINMGLFDYPVLQAADILMYHPTAIPVGKDQDQHLELTREIARFYNNKFGNTFKEPQTLHTETSKIMSILEPEKKMSKSLGDNHCVYLDDDEKIISKKLSKAPTDSGDASSKGGKNLLALLKLFNAEAYKQFNKDAKHGSLRYGDLKKQLANDIAQHFAEFQDKLKNISDKQALNTFITGSEKARVVAEKTMEKVRKQIGIR